MVKLNSLRQLKIILHLLVKSSKEKLKEKYFNGALKDIENAIELNPRIVAVNIKENLFLNTQSIQ